MDQKQLRALVARMEERVALASKPAASDEDRAGLTNAWGALLTHLAVEPAPDLRSCPTCHREIMRAATLCGYCWTKSTDGGVHA
jgi:hypothetical protein